MYNLHNFFNEIMYNLHNFPIIFIYFWSWAQSKWLPAKKEKKILFLVCQFVFFFCWSEERIQEQAGRYLPTTNLTLFFWFFFKSFQASSAMTKLQSTTIYIFAHAKAKHLLFSKSKPKIARYSFEVSSLFSDISQGISACSLHTQDLSFVF